MAMDVHSEMMNAENEIRSILDGGWSPGEAMNKLIEAFNRRESSERELFVTVLSARIVGARSAAQLLPG